MDPVQIVTEVESPAEALSGDQDVQEGAALAPEQEAPALEQEASVPEQEPAAPEEKIPGFEQPPAEALSGDQDAQEEAALAPEQEAPALEQEAPASEQETLVPEQESAVLEEKAPEVEQGDTSEMGELPVEDWDYQRPRRGQVRSGVILAIQDQEIIVDVGGKRDGIVPYADMQRMGPEALAEFSVGDEVPVYILRPEDQDGNLLVSLFMARQAHAWTRAQELADSGEVWEEQVIGYNKGGLVVPVGEIRGFVPASQVPGFPLGLGQEERIERLSSQVGETLHVKVIEINRRKRRLILSATAAQREWRNKQRTRLLSELREGEVRAGVVSSLCNFGAFVDLGGADGLVHLSELSWRRIRHPREVVSVGEEVEVYVLRLDEEKKRIGLSLKRLQPEPWALVEDKYELGQLVEGVVTNVVDFGAFAEIEDGVEGLIHVSELADGSISHPRDVVKKGDLLLLRIIRIDTRRKRLGLSLKRVLEAEWAEWAARLAVAEAEREAEAKALEPPAAEEPAEPEAEVEVDQELADTEAPVAEQIEEAEEPAEPEAEVEVDQELADTEAPVAEQIEEAEEPAEPEAEVEADQELADTEAPVAEAAEEAEEPAEPEAEVEADQELADTEPPVAEEAEEAEEPAEPEAEVEVDQELAEEKVDDEVSPDSPDALAAVPEEMEVEPAPAEA